MNKNNLKLELVQVIFRHGARTPSKKEANYFNITDPSIYDPPEFYQLTNEGKSQAYRLGSLLRKEYDEFLGDYKPENVYSYSSMTSRTKMSLELVLAGLFPLIKEEKWYPGLKLRSIPYEYAKEECDPITTPHQCVTYFKVFKDDTVDYLKDVLSKYKELYDYLEKNTGIQFARINPQLAIQTMFTYIVTEVHKETNLPLPEWCTDDIIKTVREVSSLHMNAMSSTPKLKKINGGILVRQVLQNIELKKTVEKSKKIFLYSTHDLTIASFAIVCKVNAFDLPPFGCAMILEKFSNDNGEEYVRMRYWNGTSESFTSHCMGSHGEYCPLEIFKDMVKDLLPTDDELKFLCCDGSVKSILE